MFTIPGFYRPANITAAADLLPFDDFNWGIVATAAELAFADIVYEDKAADLNGKANALYRAMSNNNRSGTYGNTRIIPRRPRNSRIRDTRSES